MSVLHAPAACCKWARQVLRLLGNENIHNDTTTALLLSSSLAQLDAAAAKISPGAQGFWVALATFQGSTTPVTDPLARGALVGLTLQTHHCAQLESFAQRHLFLGPEPVWGHYKVLLQSTTTTTTTTIVVFQKLSWPGGATRSPFWLQMHADVTGQSVVVCESEAGGSNARLLGCAILAIVAMGVHASVESCRCENGADPSSTTRTTSSTSSPAHTRLYHEVYAPLAEAVRPVMHAAVAAPTQATSTENHSGEAMDQALGSSRGGASQNDDTTTTTTTNTAPPLPMVSPSLFACDWAHMEREVHKCCKAHARILHLDIFDGVD